MTALENSPIQGAAATARTPIKAVDCFDVAVIGGGFAGTAVAVQLARLAKRPLTMVMFDRAGAFGRGWAYGPGSDDYVLNVRAKAMGAFPDAEDDFLQWLRGTGYGADDAQLGERFVPRRLYGDYLCSLLERCSRGGSPIEQRAAHVVALESAEDGYVLETACGSRARAKAVVVAIGNLPPGGLNEMLVSAAVARQARNPWELLARGAVERDARVLILGTGLTALDVLLHFDRHAHRGEIVMLSRHGRFPLAHAPSSPGGALPLAPITGTPREVLRAVRRLAGDAARANRSWHDVIDGLRPQVNRIWESWTPDERRQFYRHLSPLWEIHRHRAPQSLLTIRDALAAAGRLRVCRGRVRALVRGAAGYRVTYSDGQTARTMVAHADVIVDCTGPRREISNAGDALIDALFAGQLARPGPLGVGFAATSDGSLTATRGAAPLYALGPPLRGMLAESSAVREIRLQARTIAQAILAASDRHEGL